MNKNELVGIREGIEDDNSFIYATMLRGLFYGDSYYSEVPKSVFMEQYHQVIEKILNNPQTRIFVACLKDDPETILGYSLINQNYTACHFLFVKKVWRNIGIATQLVPPTVTAVTHLTKTGLALVKKRNLVFNPFLIEKRE